MHRSDGRVWPAVAASVAVLALTGATPAWSFGEGPAVSPTITAQPIRVVIWIRDNVATEDETRTVADIEAGLALWENVPTSHLAFDTVVIRSATEPATEPEDLLVIAAYEADLAQGGASLPSGGFPGTWFGAVADFPGDNFPLVAAHEVGHAIGFLHSSVGTLEFSANIPVMHWALAGVVDLTDDDIAMISTMYPSTTTPLETVTGTIRGRVLSLDTGLPLDGVNVVAVDAATGAPSVARLSGLGATPDGEFRLVGLPPGDYNVRLLDGNSFAGTSFGMAEWEIQADNFPATTLGSYSILAGGVTDLADISLAIEPMSFDRIGIEIVPRPDDLDPAAGELPHATQAVNYNAYLHLRGGARPVETIGGTFVPGLTSFVFAVHQQGADPHGNVHLLLSGHPVVPGSRQVAFDLRDDHGLESTEVFDLVTVDPCDPALGADLDADGVCDDGDGSGTVGDMPCVSGQRMGCDDNCPFLPNADQQDTDVDGAGDRCDVVFLPQLIDFETDGAGLPLPPGTFGPIALDEYADRGLRFSPYLSQQGFLLDSRSATVDTRFPEYPAGFADHFLVMTGPEITELHFNPPVTDVSFAFAAPGGFNPPTKLQGFDEQGNLVIDTEIQGTVPWGFIHAGQFSFVTTARLVTLRFDPQSANAMRLDSLAFRPTNCAIGLDPEGDGVCDPAQTVPPVVPDGSFGTPLLISRTAPQGSTLDLSWDVTTCPATDYNVLYGDLSMVSSLSPTGSVCNLGTTGTYRWQSIPSGDVWILIVGDNGDRVEGSWGLNSDGEERVANASGECDNVFLSVLGVCPTP